VAGGGGVQPEQRLLVAGGDLLQRLQLLVRAVEARGGGEFGELPVGAVEVVLGGVAVVGHPRRAGGELAHRAEVGAAADRECNEREREARATPASMHGPAPCRNRPVSCASPR